MTKKLCIVCRKGLGSRNKKFCPKHSLRGKLSGRDYVREQVRIKANHTCQKCNRIWQEGERRFDIHHLLDGECGSKTKKYDKVEDIYGLICLCHRCHLNLSSVKEKMKLGQLIYEK